MQFSFFTAAFLLCCMIDSCFSSFQQSYICSRWERDSASKGDRCPQVDYQAVIGEARSIIYAASDSFSNILVTDSGSTLKFANDKARVMTRLLQQYLISLASKLRYKYSYSHRLTVSHAWDDQVTDDTRALPIYHEGRAAKISASGLSLSVLFSLAVQAGFGWVYYASSSHIIVAVEEQCRQPVDIGIWIDSSGSLDYDDFEFSVEFTERLVQRFEISPDQVRVSVGTFSKTIEYYDFNRGTSNSKVLSLINSLPRLRSYTYTDLALEAWSQNIFTASGGVRARDLGIPRVGIILTDGKASRAFSHRLPAVRNLGIDVFAVGVGGNVDESELEEIASSPADEHVILADSYDIISSFVSALSTSSCRSPTPIDGSQSVDRTGTLGQVFYYRLTCKFISKSIRAVVTASQGSVSLYASDSSSYPGQFSNPSLVIGSNNVVSAILNLTLQNSYENVYASVGCQSRVTVYRILMYEVLFADSLVAEVDGSASAGTVVLPLASPYIKDYSEYSISITNGNGNGLFGINPDSGQIITVGAFQPVHTAFTLTISAVSKLVSCRRSVTVVYVWVRHSQNRFPPIIGQPTTHLFVSERASVGFKVHDFDISDADVGDNGEFSASLISGNSLKHFTLTSAGVLKVADALNASDIASYTFELVAKDFGTPSQSSRHNFRVTVIDENDPPVFIEDCARRSTCTCSVSEGAPGRTVVCDDDMVAFDIDVDPDYRQIYYAVQPVTGGDFLSISANGILFVDGVIDREALSQDNTFSVRISNFPDHSIKSITYVTVTVLDVNDNAPQFSQSIYSFTISEEAGLGQLVGMVQAKDIDAGENGIVRFDIPAQFPFSIERDGNITVAGALDREVTDTYTFFISATDEGAVPMSSKATVIVKITDVNDNAPILSAKQFSGTVFENAVLNAIVPVMPAIQAEDVDAGLNGEIVFFLLHKYSSFPFAISPDSGDLSVQYPMFLDAETVPQYNFSVVARDTGFPSLRVTSFATVSVLDVNDVPPAFDSPSYHFSVAENVMVGHSVGQVSAVDGDTIPRPVTYSITSNFSVPFILNDTTGELTSSQLLDYETTPRYVFSVQAVDSGRPSPLTSSVSVVVDVIDVPDTVPVAAFNSLNITIPENLPVTTMIGQVATTQNDSFRFADGPDTGTFQLDESSGIINLALALDFELQTSYQLVIEAYNPLSPSLYTNISVYVYVTDINDNPPAVSGVPLYLEVLETIPEFTILFDVEVTDADSPSVTDISTHLSITPSSLACGAVALSIYQNGSVFIGVGGFLNRPQCVYYLNVIVFDFGSSTQSLSTIARCQLSVIDVNDNAPVFRVPSPQNFSVAEGGPQIQKLAKLIADDSDTGANAEITYNITSCLAFNLCSLSSLVALSNCIPVAIPACPFAIDDSNGALYTLKSFDHEFASLYVLTVLAMDGGNPPLGSSLTVRVGIEDINDSPLMVDSTIVRVDLWENSSLNTLVTILNISDNDNFGTVPVVTVSQIVNPNYYSFAYQQSDSQISLLLSSVLDYETDREISIVATIWDGTFTAESTVNINVLDVNDNAPSFSESAYIFNITEGVPIDSFVGQIHATDLDSPSSGILEYYFMSVAFAIDAANGSVTTITEIDYEMQSLYTFFAYVRDGVGSDSFSSSAMVTVYVENVDDNPPMIVNPGDITVNLPTSTDIANISATDADEPNSEPLVVFSITGSNATYDNSSSTHYLTLLCRSVLQPQSYSVTTIRIILLFPCKLVRFSINPSSGVLSMSVLCSVDFTIPTAVPLGSSITLVCDAVGNGAITYLWYRDSNLLQSTVNSGALELQNVLYSDQGLYNCEVFNSAGRLSGAPQVLSVDGPPTVQPLDSIIVATGIDVVFECNVISTANYSVSWSMNGQMITSQDRIGISGDVLTISGTLETHEGQYTCEATNAAGTATSGPANLTVCECREPFTENFTFTIERRASSDSLVGIVESPYQMFFNYLYEISSGNSDRLFSIEETSGTILLSMSIEKNPASQFVLTVSAVDRSQSYSGSATVTVNVLDVNSYAPEFVPAPKTVHVVEGSPAGTDVLSFDVLDHDFGENGRVNVTLIDYQHFKLTQNPPSWDVTTRTVFNASEISIIHILFIARDFANPPSETHYTVQVNITDVNSPPVFIPDCVAGMTCQFSFPENTSAGSVIAMLPAYDVDRQPPLNDISYSVSGSAYFLIDDDDGTITLSSLLDFDSSSSNSFQLSVLATDGGGASSTAEVTLVVTDVNDNSPFFSSSSDSITFELEESLSPMSVVGTISASDRDSGPNGMILYSLLGTVLFTIQTDNGQLLLVGRLDYETATNHTFTVTATDQGVQPRDSSITVIVNVIDVNDVSPQLRPLADCLNVSEDTPPATPIWTAEIENGVSAVVFAVSQAASETNFVIDSQRGLLSLVKPLDAEEQDLLTLTVTASIMSSTSVLSDTLVICIRVEDVNDNVPYFVQSPYNLTIPRQAGAGSVIDAIAAVDADSSVLHNPSLLQYSILSGNDNGFFAIGGSSGLLSLTQAYSLALARPFYLLQVAVTDGLHQTTTLVFLETLDFNFQLPLFSIGTLYVSVSENNPVGVELALLDTVFVTAYFGSSLFTVSVMVISDPPISVVYNTSSTALVLESVLDRETIITNPFRIEILTSLPSSGRPALPCNVSVSVVDVNDNAPQLVEPGPFVFEVPESLNSGDVVFKLNATDSDENNFFIFTLTALSTLCQQAFAVNRTTGHFFVLDDIILTYLTSCHLDVLVSDSGIPPLSTMTEITLTIQDINDNSPMFTESPYTFHTSESEDVSRVFGFVAATDSDRGLNGLVTYSMKPNSLASMKSGQNLPNSGITFSIHASSGGITASSSFDYEHVDRYLFVVIAQDGGIPSHSSQVQVIINVLDYNDNTPQFGRLTYVIDVPESVIPGTVILNITASDLDGPANSDLVYSLSRQNPYILIEPSTGQISTTQRSLDFEEILVITDIVSVFDGNTYGVTVISIFVQNENDNEPIFGSNCFTTVPEDFPVGDKLITCSAVDGDVGAFGELRFDIIEGNDKEMFSLTPFTAELHLNKELDYEDEKMYVLTIQAADKGGRTATTFATVIVQNVNDNPPVLFGDVSFSVSEIPQNRSIQLLELLARDADTTTATAVIISLDSDINTDVFLKHFGIYVNVMDNTGLSSRTLIQVTFAFRCEIVQFGISRLQSQSFLELQTLCAVKLEFQGQHVLNGWLLITVVPIGVIPVNNYCWYRNSELLDCTDVPYFYVQNLTLVDEGVYYVEASTALGSVFSDRTQFEIEVPPYLNTLLSVSVQFQQSAVFTCWINNPKRVPLQYKWLFNGQELNDYDRSVQLVDGPFHYFIENVEFPSQGAYTCEVSYFSSVSITVSQSAGLQVYYGASLINLDIAISNYSYEHYCQLFDINVYLADLASLFNSDTSSFLLNYESSSLCEPGLCFPNPCQYSGRCILEGNSSRCHCLPGRTGEFCETALDLCSPANNPCSFNGVCQYLNGFYGCLCPPGRTGWNCELISDVCTVSSCLPSQVCVPSLSVTSGFVCIESYFKVIINREFYLTARGYLPVGDISASRITWNITASADVLQLYDFEVLVRSIVVDSIETFTFGPATGCTPRLISADGEECEFAMICPGQALLQPEDEVALCRALVGHSLFAECTSPSTPSSPITTNTTSGHIDCDFYLSDENNQSLPASDVLDVLEQRQVIYINRTEYRVLAISRTNNDSDVVDRAPVGFLEDGFPLWAAVLFSVLLAGLCVIACVVLVCCLYCTKRRKKIVEKQYIVKQPTTLPEDDKGNKGQYYDADYVLEMPVLDNGSSGYVDHYSSTGELIGEEEFYVNPDAVVQADPNLSQGLRSQQSSFTERNFNEYEYVGSLDQDFQAAKHTKKVTVVNPLTKQHTVQQGSKSTKSMYSTKSEDDYVEMTTEHNPLYASARELQIVNTTEVVVDTEVVIENQGTGLAGEGSPASSWVYTEGTVIPHLDIQQSVTVFKTEWEEIAESNI